MKKHSVDVCVVGGGPAGMVLALLLAHKGLKVLVLEKNGSFDREYRGEVLMPRFSQMFRQLGLEKWLLGLTHLKFTHGDIFFHKWKIGHFDFSSAAPDTPYALWMPQTVLLEALYERAKTLPTFDLWFDANAKHLIREADTVRGARVKKGAEEIEVEARVTIGADGRYSTVSKEGNFEEEYYSHRFDVLWFTIKKPKNWDNGFKVLLTFHRNFLLLPKHPDEIQAGILVDPGGMQKIRDRGIEQIRKEMLAAHPVFKDFATQMKDFTDFHPLKAELFMMREWSKNGCLLIGDSAHCCSPAGAIGVSVAVGTAVIAADVIHHALKGTTGPLPKSVLSKVQQIRDQDVRQIHSIQRRLTAGTSIAPARIALPLMVMLLARTPIFARFQRRLMALPGPLPISPELAL